MAIKDNDFESLVREHEAMLCGIAYNFFLSCAPQIFRSLPK